MAEVENIINISVKKKIATLTDINFELVGGNSDYKVVFDFDEDWAEHHAKTALFVFGNNTIKKVFEGNVCDGVSIENATMCFVGVFSGDMATTTPACLSGIRQSIRDVANGLPEAPEEDVYNQIIDLLNRYLEQGGGGSGGGGADGFSTKVEVTLIDGGHIVTITDKEGPNSFIVKDGEDGKDYVLTEADRKEIVSEVVKIVDPSSNLQFILSEDKTYYICDGGEVLGDLVIPSSYKGLPVIEIADGAFYGDRLANSRAITSVIIPASVQRIGEQAFEQQWSLGKIVLKGTPEIIGLAAFATTSMAAERGEEAVECNLYVPFGENEVDGAPWGITGTVHYETKTIEDRVAALEERIGDIDSAFDDLHNYAQNLVNGGATV
jgi:hypothetical protein